jgi:hypothetical protein
MVATSFSRSLQRVIDATLIAASDESAMNPVEFSMKVSMKQLLTLQHDEGACSACSGARIRPL